MRIPLCLHLTLTVLSVAIPLDVTQLRAGPIRAEQRTDAVAIPWQHEQGRDWSVEFWLAGNGALTSVIR